MACGGARLTLPDLGSTGSYEKSPDAEHLGFSVCDTSCRDTNLLFADASFRGKEDVQTNRYHLVHVEDAIILVENIVREVIVRATLVSPRCVPRKGHSAPLKSEREEVIEVHRKACRERAGNGDAARAGDVLSVPDAVI